MKSCMPASIFATHSDTVEPISGIILVTRSGPSLPTLSAVALRAVGSSLAACPVSLLRFLTAALGSPASSPAFQRSLARPAGEGSPGEFVMRSSFSIVAPFTLSEDVIRLFLESCPCLRHDIGNRMPILPSWRKISLHLPMGALPGRGFRRQPGHQRPSNLDRRSLLKPAGKLLPRLQAGASRDTPLKDAGKESGEGVALMVVWRLS